MPLNFLLTLFMAIKFCDPRSTVTCTLPSFAGSEVVMVKSLLVGEQRDLSKRFPNQATDNDEGLQATVEMLVKAIRSWNFVGEDDQALPITSENLFKLPNSDLMAMVHVLVPETKKGADEGKKGQ